MSHHKVNNPTHLEIGDFYFCIGNSFGYFLTHSLILEWVVRILVGCVGWGVPFYVFNFLLVLEYCVVHIVVAKLSLNFNFNFG